MLKQFRLTLILLIGDLTFTLAALWLTSHLRPTMEMGAPITPEQTRLPLPVYGLALIIWFTVFILLSVYHTERRLRASDEMQSVIIGVVMATLAFAGALYFSYRDISRLQILLYALLDILFLLVFRGTVRLLLMQWGRDLDKKTRVLVVGAGEVGLNIAETVDNLKWAGLELAGFLDDNPEADSDRWPILGLVDQAQAVSIIERQRIDEVIFALPLREHAKLVDLVTAMQETRANIRVVPDLFDLAFLRARVEDFGGTPLLTLREPALDPFQRLLKRAFDLAVGSLSMVVALPLMGLVALAVKLDSPGPVLFKQKRVGEAGKLFTMYKFRSMVDGADDRRHEVITYAENGQIIHKKVNDPRVTRLGAFLRRTSLDELP
ncbi:MAG: sugar transferase, partial [Anaerolineae bacterium]